MTGLKEGAPRRGVPGPRRVATFVLLALPFVACLYPGWYNRIEPEFFGVPFFIAYQMALVFVGSAVMAAVYLLDGGEADEPPAGSPASAALHDNQED